MPTYEYECAKCKRTFEYEQKLAEPALTECPQTVMHPLYATVEVACGGEVRRLIPSSTSFILNGKGWAKDGYK